MSERLIVVSNRLPLTVRRVGDRWQSEPSSGGLVAAVAPVMERNRGIWIGWPGDGVLADDPCRAELLAEWEREHRLVAVDLPARISSAFYDGYSNTTLWPLMHGFPSRVVFDAESWQAYRDANERFAAAVAARTRPGDIVWVHDYQLMLVPRLLRDALPDVRVGFFLHIPFPSPEVFRILPEREALLDGLLGADLVAFQTHEHLGSFRRALLQILGLDSRMDRVDVDGRPVKLDALPIGIVPDEWGRLSTADARVARRVTELRTRHAGRRLILAVDRLDYTKGIPERLATFRHLLRTRPGLRGSVVLVQVAVPSREHVRRYAELRREVSEMVGDLNGEFGTPDWTPVIYLRRSQNRVELAALYSAADVAWVAPLRDGMNLVAKEFVACQGEGRGVLVISEFAGAAREMGEAIRVNPYDVEGSARAVERALELPDEDRQERQAALLARVRHNSAFAWSQRFVERLRMAADQRSSVESTESEPPIPAIREAYRSASRRTVFLDYDGTLVALAERPSLAVPTEAALEVVATLARQPETTVVIVSGRPRADLDRWFGSIPRIWLAAEHGAVVREPGATGWTLLRPGADTDWKALVRPVLGDFGARAPGSLLEEKAYSIALHLRMADPEFGEWLANELATTLDERLSGTELAVLRGKKVIEVRFAWADKGEVAAHVLAAGPPSGFLLAVGDDRTDEDLFARLPDDAWTVRVGPGLTRARYRIPGPRAVIGMLAVLGPAQ
jgi:trehalose 6-phosphate synthase/phosphatase